MQKHTPQLGTIDIKFKGRIFTIEYFYRKGNEETVLFVHGLGGAKENFWTACQSEMLSGHTIVCFDNPGTGNSSYHDDLLLDIDDLVEITSSFIDQLDLNDFILAGASMGGLTTLLYLQRNKRKKVKGYINIEGNLMPEDCMFSGKVVIHEPAYFRDTVFPAGIREMKEKGNAGYHIIANNLELNTNINAYYQYSFQTVAYSSSGELLRQYLALNLPRIFIYGDKNQALSYLPALHDAGMRTSMVRGSDHFVFYDNPTGMYQAISDFISTL